MTTDAYKQSAIAWLRQVLAETGLSPGELAANAGLAATTLTRPLNNPDHPYAISGRTLAAVAAAANKPMPSFARGGAAEVSWLEYDSGPAAPRPKDPAAALIFAPEFDPGQRNANAAEARAFWPFDPVALAGMGISGKRLAVYPVLGEAMAGTLAGGDRVLIDRADTKLEAGGLFALWDGAEVICRRIVRAPGPAGPRLLLTADAPHVNEREIEAEWLEPVGRIILIVRRPIAR